MIIITDVIWILVAKMRNLALFRYHLWALKSFYKMYAAFPIIRWPNDAEHTYSR